MNTMQDLLTKLTSFWISKGVTFHVGHDVESGAATFNPATFLRCLGPEPYNTAYFEPCRRPSDARYAQNPNRLHIFHQFQVLMKPTPPNLQELYVESLAAIGIDLSKHDIRFVHDDWENPTIGAYGLGWEVWMDGMEITQYTYFQGVGSIPLKVISGELAYGVERLAMYLQNVDNVFDVKWDEKLTLRDIIEQNEIEWSHHNFEEAPIEMWQRHFADFEGEAKRLIRKGFPIPGYDFVMKASHAFNILESRGAISVTERTGYIGRIRDLAREVANGYLKSREEKGYPLLRLLPKIKETKENEITSRAFDPKKKETLLFEIGSEELPSTFVPIGMRELRKRVENLLSDLSIPHGTLSIFGTPRRLAIEILDLPEGTFDTNVVKKGPPLKLAFDAQGSPTKQGIGFFASVGMEPLNLNDIRAGKNNSIQIETVKEEETLSLHTTNQGQSIATILSTHLPKIIRSMEFPKLMHWDETEVTYPRPIKWLLCMHGANVIPVAYGHIHSGSTTRGHAQRANHAVPLSHAKQYLEQLRSVFVIADPGEREALILKGLHAIEESTSSTAQEKHRVLSEVLHLTEYPELIACTFNEKFLKAPKEVLILEMVLHQKYFPLALKNGQLLNSFVVTADNLPSDLIRKGNEKVLSARLSDGVFLYNQDVEMGLEKMGEKLQFMTFQKDLGSMQDKVERMKKVLSHLPKNAYAMRAADLCKCDLASDLVGEFPELQGTAGKYYATASLEHADVATAIEQHWWPKGDKAPLPETETGTLLSLADKLDNLLGYFSVGLKPTSSSDPYALRRQTLGILRMLLENNYDIDLSVLIPKLESIYKGPSISHEVQSYITERAKPLFVDRGFKKEDIEAVLAHGMTSPLDVKKKLQALGDFRTEHAELFRQMGEVYKRAKGQLKDYHKSTPTDMSLLTHQSEKDLIDSLQQTRKKFHTLQQKKDFLNAFHLLSHLHPKVAALFDDVMIQVEDVALRRSRLDLLSQVVEMFDHLLDFSQVR